MSRQHGAASERQALLHRVVVERPPAMAEFDETAGSPRAQGLPVKRRDLPDWVLDAVGSLVVALDRQGHIVCFNRACEEATGYSADEVRGKLFWDLLLPSKAVEAAKEFFSAPTLLPVVGNYVATWLAKDGGHRTIAWVVRFVREGDELAHVVAAGSDITEHKRAREALRQSEERFRKIFVEGPLGMCLISPDDYRMMEVNKRLCDMLGYTAEELMALPFPSITHPEDIEKDVDLARQVFGSEIPYYQIEKRYIKKNGAVLWGDLTAMLVRDAEAQPLYGLGIILDITERKQAEQALSESEANFRGIFENIRDVFYRVDLGGVIQMVSPSVSRYGYRPDELIGNDFNQISIGERNRSESIRLLNEYGEISDFDVMLKCKDGKRVPVSVNAHVLRDRDGNLVGIEGLVRDIGEYKRMEEELRQSEATFRGIVEHSQDVFYRVDAEGVLRMISSSVSRFGYTPDELIGIHTQAFLNEPERTRFRQTVLKQGSVEDVEFTVPCKDGTERVASLSLHVYRDADGQPGGIEGWVRDISERKRMENALRKSEANFRGIFEKIQDVFYRVDLSGNIQMVSPSVSQFGYTVEELTGLNLEGRRDVNRRNEFLQLLIDRGELTDQEVEAPRKDGSLVTVSASAHLLRDDDGRPVGIEGTVRDISQRKRAEEAARQRDIELAHMLRLSTVGEMAAGLAHEISQPLAAIANYANGCARRIETGVPGSARLLEAVQQIAAEALRAGEIIRRLRAFVRKDKPQRESVDINYIVQEVVRSVGTEARRRDVTIELDLAPALPRLDADGIQIQQVLINLVRNGFEAMEDNDHRPRTVAIRTVARNGKIVASVRDSGTGFSQMLASQMFEPFFTTKNTGMGLGLAISRSIVKAHGGRLWARANSDGGATFGLTLPTSNGENGDAG